jgi:prepilin-type processing-associated H-X9-DG protein
LSYRTGVIEGVMKLFITRGVGATALTMVLVILAAATPVVAHHSFAAEFDRDKPLKLTGKITRMRWSNPHAWIYIDVPDGEGKVTNWGFEMGGVNALYRRGWRQEDLTPGLEVVIDGWAARNGSNTGNAATITFADGHKLFARADAPALTPPGLTLSGLTLPGLTLPGLALTGLMPFIAPRTV